MFLRVAAGGSAAKSGVAAEAQMRCERGASGAVCVDDVERDLPRLFTLLSLLQMLVY